MTQGSAKMAHFTPFTKTSIDVMVTIKEAAKDRNIKKEEIDFDLLSVETLIISPKHKEWTIIDEPLEKIFDEKTLRSESLHIRQEYQINIRPYKTNNFFNNIEINIASNKVKSKIVATFKKGSIFPCDKNLAKLLKKEINYRKLRLGILIGHFEKNLNSTLIKLTKALKCQTPLSKDIRIIIAESPGATLAIDDAIIPHYEKKQKEKKSFIDGVDANELIFEYIKPKNGKNGRSTKGDYIISLAPKINYANYKADDKTIRIKDSAKSVKYYSKVDGYVKNSSGLISISKDIAIKAATFRDTGSIDTGEDKDISVHINNKNSSDDAVGSGVSIDVKELDVQGTVGSNAKVKANELSVGEQTHRNSQLEAVENAKVHLHRGKLKAKTAEIEILENGTVEADEVYVKKMLGGEIIGHRVIVEELTSNTIVIASEYIEIHKISGDHNKLIINPNKIKAYHEKVQNIRENVKIKKNTIRERKKEYEEKLSQHHKRVDRIKVFQKRVLMAVKAKKAPNKSDMIRIKQYKNDALALKEEVEYIKEKEKEITSINNTLENLYEAELHANIINKAKYDGRTQVIFVDTKTFKEYTMTPEGIYEKLFLEKDGDNKKISW